MARDDGLEFSRRAFLAAAAATGTIISSGGKTVAEFSDAESFGATLGAGELDLEVVWDGDGSEVFLGVLKEAGDGGTKDIELSLTEDSNATWLWFAMQCPTCLPIEELIDVTLELDAGDSSWLFEGTLREARATLGPWIQLDDVMEPGETWTLTVSWVLTESVDAEQTIDFDFNFKVAQRRHLVDPDTEKPTRECVDCPENGGNGKPAAISYTAFGGGSNADAAIISQWFSDDGRTLHYELGDAGAAIEDIAIKYGTNLDVFFDVADSGSLTVGDGDETYGMDKNRFSVDPPRLVNDPLPDHCWSVKFEVGEDGFEQMRRCH